ESYPETLPSDEVSLYLSQLKAAAYRDDIAADEMILTADTVVIVDGIILGKPKDAAEACHMLRMISGRTHHVVTGVSLTTQQKQRSFKVSTEVTFKALSEAEINYYVEHYQPFDKAGAYGIQEWIGYVGVISLKGSYFNVMGLPVQRIYEELAHF
ncbi:MAG: Maf family nucleotide pyrophosphatase, partial [Segatella salivae]